MDDRYEEVDPWVWCWSDTNVPVPKVWDHGDMCFGPHEPIYRKVSQCSIELRLDRGYLRCEEDEGHGDNGKLPVHGAKDGDGLMVWWQSA